MELKEFQENTLTELKKYLNALTEQEKNAREINEVLIEKGKPPMINFTDEAWKAIGRENYITRKDGADNFIPNVCLKLPTGGGKTLLATHAVMSINTHYFRTDKGLVLWVMPSEAIYSQTRKNFKNTEHPYRKVLDQAAPRKRAKILERKGNFAPYDVEQDLSVMLLMLQASNRETKAQLKMFQDSGAYISFFPESDDYEANRKLYEKIPNLDIWENNGKIAIKTSLANVLRQLRPIIVMDEGHKAYSDRARETLEGFNPRFILELSATPDKERSNILVNISGSELKKEQMIKLPIRLKNVAGSEWQPTLADACERLKKLNEKADEHREKGGKYIRPILLVRVERTGQDQREKGLVHAEDAREYLIAKCGFREDEVRVKGGGKNEIADDDLLSDTCPVRAIITKEALKEGWDCPFAYVLALLGSGTANTSLTQMVGRVLRQPYAQETAIEDLDNAHIFCFNQNVKEAVNNIHRALMREGLEDYTGAVQLDDTVKAESLPLFRRDEFMGYDEMMPRVLHKDSKGGERLLSYEADILSNIKWDTIEIDKQGLLLERDQQVTESTITAGEKTVTEAYREVMEGEANAAFFARHISDIIPNPWQAMRIAEEAMLRLKGSATDIYNNRMHYVRQMRESIIRQTDEKSEQLFKKKIQNKEIIFSLDATQCGWELPRDIKVRDSANLRFATRNGTGMAMEKTFITLYEERDFNQFELKVASYLDEVKAIKWWHRVASKNEYGLQGWRKHLVYPDFIAFASKDGEEYFIFETKGKHLQGNLDTNYKKVLFDILEEHSASSVGEVTVSHGNRSIKLKMLFEGDWKERLHELGINRN